MQYPHKKTKTVVSVFVLVIFLGLFLACFRAELLSMVSHVLKFSAKQLRNVVIMGMESNNSDNENLRLFTIAELYFENKDYKKTISYCNDLLSKKDLEIKPKIRTLSLLAIANFRMGNFDDVQSISEKLVKIDPAWGHFLKGLIYNEIGNFKEARDEICLSLKFDEDTRSLDDAVRAQAVKLLKRLDENNRTREEGSNNNKGTFLKINPEAP